MDTKRIVKLSKRLQYFENLRFSIPHADKPIEVKLDHGKSVEVEGIHQSVVDAVFNTIEAIKAELKQLTGTTDE